MNTVLIGKNNWMTKNLNIETFRNGDSIQHAKTNEEWEKAGMLGEPAWCYYDNNQSNSVNYGKLYNWFAINDKRGLAPLGLRIASEEDWNQLIQDVTDSSLIKSINGWDNNGNGNDKIGFAALPGGYRSFYGKFFDRGEFGCWWCATELDQYLAMLANMASENNYIFTDNDNKKSGLSVRCIMEE